MKKKTAFFRAIALAAVLTAVFLSGCNSRNRGGGGVQRNPENLNLTGLPIVKEKETFSILADDSKDLEKTLLPIFEEETNVHLKLFVYPTSVAGERKNILLASGDYPDTIGGWLLGTNEIVKLAADGVLIPLEDLIDNYTVNIKEVLELPNVRRDMTLPDGHIYSVPYLIEEPLVTFNPWINVKWLKQLNLPMPQTTEEFKNTLIAFRDGIPPINGQKIIPFSWDPNQVPSLGILAGWFGLNASGTFAVIDGQVEITVNRPEYRAYLKYLADLYANGLLDHEIFTQDRSTWVAKGRLGLYGAVHCYWPDDFASRITDDLTVNQWDYEALPMLRAPGVEKPVYNRKNWGLSLFQSQFAITDRATNPITIIRWLDYVYGVEKSLETRYGPLGVKFEKLDDGLYREFDTSSWSEEKKEKYDNNWIHSLPVYLRQGYRKTVLPPEGRALEYDIKEFSDAVYEPYLEAEVIPPFWLDLQTSRQIAEISQPIDYYRNQKIAQWISGQADIDAEWDAYVAQLERLKIQELLRINRGLMKR
jgi:putative aldouronate transport system substrate-binding protein